jgi:hypothetical protein
MNNDNENTYEIKINNKVIWDFYNEHSSLDFETTNVMVVDMLGSILKNNKESMNVTIASQILRECIEHNKKIDTLSRDIDTLHLKINNDVANKMVDIKSQFIDDVKSINLSHMDFLRTFISSTLDEKLDVVVQKIYTGVNDYTNESINSFTVKTIEGLNSLLIQVLPNNNQILITKIQDEITKFNNILLDETKKINETPSYIHEIIKTLQEVSVKNDLTLQNITAILTGNKTSQLETFMNVFDTKYIQLQGIIQQNINEILSSSEDRIKNAIHSFQDTSYKHYSSQEKISTNLDEFFNKYKNHSSTKGKYSEMLLQNTLEKMFPICEIIDMSREESSCDLLLKRGGTKPDILFENKNKPQQATSADVEKAIKDCRHQKKCVILLSQHSTVCYKNDYQIDVIDNEFVIVYIHNVEYDCDKIRLAIDLIDTLKNNLSQCSINNGSFNITDEQVRLINHEYSNLLRQRDSMVSFLKESHKTSLKFLEDLKLPSIETIISTTIGTTIHVETNSNSPLACTICNKFVGKNKGSLSAHIKACKIKNNVLENVHV